LTFNATKIQGFFDIPVDNVTQRLYYLKIKRQGYENITVVSPDVGGCGSSARLPQKLLETQT